jgi:hypothetical protein
MKPCACGYSRASYSHRLGRHVCGRCHFGSIPEAEREVSDRGWAHRDIAGQVRALARLLPDRDPRAARLRNLALDLELAASEADAVQIVRTLRAQGVELVGLP